MVQLDAERADKTEDYRTKSGLQPQDTMRDGLYIRSVNVVGVIGGIPEVGTKHGHVASCCPIAARSSPFST